MALPTFEDLMLPLLRLAGDGRAHDLVTAERLLADALALDPEERAQRLPSGQQRVLHNRIGWASFYLAKAGLLAKPRRGRFEITDAGRQVLQAPPARIDKEYLGRFPAYAEYMASLGTTTADPGTSPDIHPEAARTADELLQEAYQQVRDALASDLLARLQAVAPEFFEQVVVDLLLALGYGGAREDAGARLGRSGDGGIDGTIKEDRLGLDVIYLQAKRWQGSVGRPEIQRFVGALHGQRAGKGIFMTTGTFTAEAREYVRHLDKKVVLVDGREMAHLMIEAGVGVTPVATYVVRRLDSDYFEDA